MKLVPLVASCQLYQRHQLVIRRQALDETGHRQSGHFPLPKLSPPTLCPERRRGCVRGTQGPSLSHSGILAMGMPPQKKALVVFSAVVSCDSPPKLQPCATWNLSSQKDDRPGHEAPPRPQALRGRGSRGGTTLTLRGVPTSIQPCPDSTSQPGTGRGRLPARLLKDV